MKAQINLTDVTQGGAQLKVAKAKNGVTDDDSSNAVRLCNTLTTVLQILSNEKLVEPFSATIAAYSALAAQLQAAVTTQLEEELSDES